MADIETKEVERVNSGIDEDGAVVRERTNSVTSKANPKSTIVNLIWYLNQAF
jgi:hypothetical protein